VIPQKVNVKISNRMKHIMEISNTNVNTYEKISNKSVVAYIPLSAAAAAYIPLSAAAAAYISLSAAAYIPLSAADTHHCSVDTDELFHAYFFYVST
jgi:hypothetical protein